MDDIVDTSSSSPPQGHEIRFDYLFDGGRSLAFPCDAMGHVDIDALSDRARTNYLYARAMVGREYALPVLCPPVPAVPSVPHSLSLPLSLPLPLSLALVA
jgi:hypothetical protein